MITRPTVLILGAGAAYELGMPLGPRLLTHVADILDPETQGTMEYPYLDVLEKVGFTRGRLERFHDAVSNTAITAIDHLLAKQPSYHRMGRAAIAAALLTYERRAAITVSPERPRWSEMLFERMIYGRHDFEENELSVITFNYDRTFEHFMFESLKRLYPGDLTRARERLASIPIVHLHGSIGGYPELTRGKGVRFGADVNPEVIERAHRRIKIIRDEEDNYGPMEYDDDFDDAYELLRDAELMLMLGFGFDPTNLVRLALDECLSDDAIVHATAYQVGNGVLREARKNAGIGERLQLHEMTCTELLVRDGELFNLE